MKKPLMILFLLLILAAAAFAVTVRCVYHDWATCSPTADYKWVEIHEFQRYSCTCGDNVWVKVY